MANDEKDVSHMTTLHSVTTLTATEWYKEERKEKIKLVLKVRKKLYINNSVVATELGQDEIAATELISNLFGATDMVSNSFGVTQLKVNSDVVTE